MVKGHFARKTNKKEKTHIKEICVLKSLQSRLMTTTTTDQTNQETLVK